MKRGRGVLFEKRIWAIDNPCRSLPFDRGVDQFHLACGEIVEEPLGGHLIREPSRLLSDDVQFSLLRPGDGQNLPRPLVNDAVRGD